MINIVLFEPEIPGNTGNIMRTCVATNSKLHLIEPLGFKITDKTIKRSGVNYIDKLDYKLYSNFKEFEDNNPGEYYYFTRYGKKPHTEFKYQDSSKEIYLIFGKESTGIPKNILKNHIDRCIRIPTSPNVRALNLSNCVAIATYEVLRQQNYPNLSKTETQKGEDWLIEE
ncbi:MAG: tRNA (cytidine(34)-2'-O)-methyltransferase [Bacilli bacterium]|nr:tRNA (cytidine(34)-2'-O)-methyltransferase [Bacilli bacterium]